MSIPETREAVKAEGFHVLSGALSESVRGQVLEALEETLGEAAVRERKGRVYAARNMVAAWPRLRGPLRETPILDVLGGILGSTTGLVRALYLDKPPGRSWLVPWHKDVTIAVKDNSRESGDFTHPTVKAGVPHVEAPPFVLSNMLLVRIHLDPVTAANGPLEVVPGSHKTGKRIEKTEPSRMLLHDAGDALVMRPLLVHRSGRSEDGSGDHRRVLHLEFAGSHRLPDRFAWHDYLAL